MAGSVVTFNRLCATGIHQMLELEEEQNGKLMNLGSKRLVHSNNRKGRRGGSQRKSSFPANDSKRSQNERGKKDEWTLI